ncbi:hypothetical protein D8674_015016 [Pyrus ussuriensis x Pyrus communis]|uniref:Uncharacterized protein n=1 Tax=Pyrus ussuriensis x Pyrus communis TaxID=2448454 RepID=A0A5N5GVF7_9ROSA|nr:hypothetical protein D8674_015016 [Pyrus ussuriensis x Pyrus communis]
MARKLGIFARQLIWNRNKLPFNCVQSQSQSQFQFQFRTTQTLTLTASIPNTNKVSSFHIPERSHADYRRREEQRPNKPTGPSNYILKAPVDLWNELQHVRCAYASAIFYITSSSCKASHKLLSPVILELSGRFLHVRVYKLVLPECDVGRNLGPFNLTTLPNVTFYQYGKKAAEVFGIDVIGVKKTFEKLFSFGEAPCDSGDLEESGPTETTQPA